MTKFNLKTNIFFKRMLFLVAMVLTGSSASWADNPLVISQSIKIGNDEGGWGGNTLQVSLFQGIDIKANDVIEITRVSGSNGVLRVNAGDWDESVQLTQVDNWNGSTQYIRIAAPAGSTSTDEDIVNLVKTKGVILNGTGPCNVKVRLILIGENRVSPSGSFSKTGISDNVAQIGDAVTYTYTLDSKFAEAQNVKYRWFIVNQSETDAPELPAGDGFVYGYQQMLNGFKWGNENTFTFIPRASTAGKKLRVCLHVVADGFATNYTQDDSGDFTIAPMHTPTITQDGNDVKISVNQGYWIKYKVNGGDETSVYSDKATVTGLNHGDVVTATTYRTVNVNGTDHYPNSESSSLKFTAPHEQLTCENNNVDLSKLVAAGNVTYDVSSHQLVVNNNSTYVNGLKIVFATPQDLSNLKKITVNGAKFANIPFTDNEGEDHYTGTYSSGDNNTVLNLNNKNNASYKNIKEIFFRDIQAGTYNISSIVFEFDHTPAVPQFSNGTTASMRVVAGAKFTLSANSGWWREYSEFNGTDDKRIATHGIKLDEWHNTVEVTTTNADAGKNLYFAAEDWKECEFGKGHASNPKNWVTVEVETPGEIPTGFNMIKQPIYNEYHKDMAKEYIAIANLTASDGTPIPCGWGDAAGYISGNGVKQSTEKKVVDGNPKQSPSTLGYMLGSNNYSINGTDGLCISQFGAAGVQAGQTVYPARGTLVFEAAGTVDFYLLAYNKAEKVDDKANTDRRHIKVWYQNDQSDELKPLICANENTDNDFWFYGERKEDKSNGLSPLSFGVRLQHLGMDGTCKVFVTYEDVASEEVWIKGLLVKRPDLTVTIGRTDGYGCNDDGTIKEGYNNNVKITPFGKGKPYQWDFGTSGFYALHDPSLGDDASNEEKKINEYDGRTYICGTYEDPETHKVTQLMDHVLVYSDDQEGADKALFDGRIKTNGKHAGYEGDATDNNEHIELRHPTKYAKPNTEAGFTYDRRSFTPILSDGLKVNVTGSGWFTIACTAPNGKVNMKVLSSTNGGNAYMNILREFVVDTKDESIANSKNPETDWHTYRVYLKAHQERDGELGFWAGDKKRVNDIIPDNGDPEQTQMSLYIVFEAIDDEPYMDGETPADAQLNIHYMQWANELPADYVYQREEDPKLLSYEQKIYDKDNQDEVVLYWQAGTSKVEGKVSVTPKRLPSSQETTYPSAFHSAAKEMERKTGQDSGWGSVSRTLGGQWIAAAPAHTIAHTEADYAGKGSNPSAEVFEGFNNAYDLTTAKSTTADNSSKNLEFAIPMSGSFFRFMPMKNQFISAFIVPEDGKAAKIFVLDETGKPIPFDDGADMNPNSNGNDNRKKLTQNGLEHGWIHVADGCEENNKYSTREYLLTNTTDAVRIDFAALAGKEYFIVSNDAKISLARLKVTDNAWRADVEAIDNGSDPALTLYDGKAPGYASGCNTTAINTAMGAKKLDYTTADVYARYAKQVKLNRKFEAGKWVSLVLPFSMNEEKFKKVFGETAQCVHFTNVDMTTNTVKLTHHFYNMIVAGRPVFVKPTKDVDNPVITDVTLQTKEITNTLTPSGLTFVGSFDSAQMDKNDFYLNDNNKFKYLAVDGGATYPGLRSWIKNGVYDPATGVQNSSAPVAMFLNFDDADMDEPTGIESILAEEFGQNAIVVTKQTKVYDLNGRVVANGTDISNLPSGVYIVNGKKYVK